MRASGMGESLKRRARGPIVRPGTAVSCFSTAEFYLDFAGAQAY